MIPAGVFPQIADTLVRGSPTCTAYFFTCRKSPLPANQTGIASPTRPEAEQAFCGSILNISGIIRNYGAPLAKASSSRTPVLITGEDGTGKEPFAYTIYIHSSLKSSSFIRIDCSQPHKKSWSFLLEHPSSPLSDEGNTLYFPTLPSCPRISSGSCWPCRPSCGRLSSLCGGGFRPVGTEPAALRD